MVPLPHLSPPTCVSTPCTPVVEMCQPAQWRELPCGLAIPILAQGQGDVNAQDLPSAGQVLAALACKRVVLGPAVSRFPNLLETSLREVTCPGTVCGPLRVDVRVVPTGQV